MKNLRVATLLLVVTYCTVQNVLSIPFERNMFTNHDNLSRCERNPDVDSICQRCAKITKSQLAYPMCCTDKEEAYRWCYKYINFGIQKRSFPFSHKDLGKLDKYHNPDQTHDDILTNQI